MFRSAFDLRFAIALHAPHPHVNTKASCDLSESCPQNGDVPKSPLSTGGSAGAVGGHIHTFSRVRIRPDAVSARIRSARFVRRTPLLIERPIAMQVPPILRGESRTRVLQGIAIGAVASTAIGFSWGGWMTSRDAAKLADEQANTSVVAALTPICVAKFLQNTDAKANLAVLQKYSSNWEQGDYLQRGGWATRPGATSPDYQLARACAEQLNNVKTAAE
jgi:hypothetical protein